MHLTDFWFFPIILGSALAFFGCAYCGCRYAINEYHHKTLLPALKVLAGIQAPGMVRNETVVPIQKKDPKPPTVAPRQPLADDALNDIFVKLHGSC